MTVTAAPDSHDQHDGAVAPRPDLTVILCVHNGAATMRRQLDALAAQQWHGTWEVLVVDNRSTDATSTIAGERAATDSRFRVVAAPDRAGLSHARNVGVANSAAPAVAFVDHDDEVAPGWLAAMGDALRDHPVVACRLEWDELGAPAGTRAAGGFQHHGIEDYLGFPVATGASGWQRWLWDALGGNDESLTHTGEDFDMSIRAYLEHGVVPTFEPSAVYRVSRRGDRRSTFRQARAYGRSSVTLYRRYGQGRVDRRAEVRSALKTWAWLARHVLDLREPQAGARWARRAGIRAGRLEQSLRLRTLWL
jgi:glycosyltransferase involved in cell wall biosynthesis